jgi:hypothetical protein
VADQEQSLVNWLMGRKPKPPRLSPSEMAGGHRGIAARDLRPGKQDFSEENVSKWEQLTGNEVEDFVFGGVAILVHSSNVSQLQYDYKKNVLTVAFKNGSVYEYDNVTPPEAVRFIQATSKGGSVWDLLRVRGSRTGHQKPFRKIR